MEDAPVVSGLRLAEWLKQMGEQGCLLLVVAHQPPEVVRGWFGVTRPTCSWTVQRPLVEFAIRRYAAVSGRRCVVSESAHDQVGDVVCGKCPRRLRWVIVVPEPVPVATGGWVIVYPVVGSSVLRGQRSLSGPGRCVSAAPNGSCRPPWGRFGRHVVNPRASPVPV